MKGLLAGGIIMLAAMIIPQHTIPLLLTAGFAWFAIKNGR